MEVWNGIERLPDEMTRVVASIGNYDGVHLGHRAILRGAVAEARRRALPSLLITFEPHPLAVVAPQRRPRRLQTRRQKLQSLEALGLTDLLLIEFSRELAALSGDEFFSQVLTPRLEFAALHVGENFRFGHDRGGDLTLLKTLGERFGFRVRGIAPVLARGRPVSSSRIREAVEGGRVEEAAEMLGRPFSLEGEVVRGAGRGGRMDFPTANLEVDNEIRPARGTYVTETVVLAGRHPSVTNVGVRPTFGGGSLTVETHLIEFSGELYGQRMEIRFLARVRDEMAFSGPEQLADQMARDRAAAAAYFANVRFPT